MPIVPRPGKRRMRWVVAYRDATGARRYKTCYSEEDAKRFEAARVLEPGGDPNCTLASVGNQFLERASATVRPPTLELYRRLVRLHIMPELGSRRVSSLKPSDVELLLIRKIESGLAPKTVTLIQAVLFGILKRAVRDGLIPSNPASGMTRELGLWRKVRASRQKIKAFTPEQLEAFRKKCREMYPELELQFRFMVSTGVRIGESIALRWEDVAFDTFVEDDDGERAYGVAVRRNMRRDRVVDDTKNSWARWVDIDQDLRDALWSEYQRFLARNLRAGRTLDPWVFSRADGTPRRDKVVREQFGKIAKAAELPKHLSPHCLRHTFASVHIQQGTRLEYLKEQLGHSSIQMTYDVYGHWLNKSSPAAAKRLQDAIRWAGTK